MRPSPSPFAPPGPARWPMGGVWASWCFLVLGGSVLGLPAAHRDLLLNLVVAAVFLAATLTSFRRARGAGSAGPGWRLFGLAMLAQVLTQAWALGYLLRFHHPPAFPSVGELFTVLSLGLIIAALLAWPLTPATGSERLRKGLDGLGIATAAFFVTWILALGPLFHAVPVTLIHRWTLLGFLLGNATILGLGAYLAARQPGRIRGPLGWVILAFVLSTTHVTITVPLSLAGRYYVGHPLDLLVLLAGLGVLLATLAPQSLHLMPPLTEEVRESSVSTLVLPLLPALLAAPFAVAVLFLAPERLDASFVFAGMAITGLGLARGLLAQRDLQLLSAALESRVHERTRSLAAAQELLVKTERLNGLAILGAGLAHDFKNLLGVIRLRADLLAARLGQDPQFQADLGGLQEATSRAETLTANLLAFGRNEESDPLPVDLSQRLQELHPLLRAALPATIQLDLLFPPIPARVLCQPGSLDQLIVNLVLNARDAMPQGGLLRLAVSRRAPGAPVELAVSDTGQGIPEAVQARVFEPFFTTKGPGVGTGLGLASVHQTVQQLGGTIALTSARGQGTTFTLTFPAVR